MWNRLPVGRSNMPRVESIARYISCKVWRCSRTIPTRMSSWTRGLPCLGGLLFFEEDELGLQQECSCRFPSKVPVTERIFDVGSWMKGLYLVSITTSCERQQISFLSHGNIPHGMQSIENVPKEKFIVKLHSAPIHEHRRKAHIWGR